MNHLRLHSASFNYEFIHPRTATNNFLLFSFPGLPDKTIRLGAFRVRFLVVLVQLYFSFLCLLLLLLLPLLLAAAALLLLDRLVVVIRKTSFMRGAA